MLAVPPAYTSQRCAYCGHTAKENRLSQSKFRCQVCGYTANADVNGARNILAAGHAVLACGEMVQSGRPLKQEPTEKVTGVVKNVTVSQSCGKWYISIQTESEVSTPVHPSASMIGLDAGVAKLATLSDGTVFEPVNSFQKNQKTLARLQRQLSRKVKFSNNWQKQKRKIQRLHSCIANIRRDYLHKVTTTVSKNHAMIVIEDLKVSNMSKSAAGTVSLPGRNVRAKSGLNRSILDQGWYEIRRQLAYKQLWRGGQVLAVPPAYTSQRCVCCGHTAKENRLSQSKFRCQVCGYTANADVNGARNILAAGHAVLACGEMVQSGRSLKQEPTEMIQATA